MINCVPFGWIDTARWIQIDTENVIYWMRNTHRICIILAPHPSNQTTDRPTDMHGDEKSAAHEEKQRHQTKWKWHRNGNGKIGSSIEYDSIWNMKSNVNLELVRIEIEICCWTRHIYTLIRHSFDRNKSSACTGATQRIWMAMASIPELDPAINRKFNFFWLVFLHTAQCTLYTHTHTHFRPILP